MREVKIISGTYGYNNGKHIEPKDRTSAPFPLADDEAERLVRLGIAEIVLNKVATCENGEEINSPSANSSNAENSANGKNEGGNDIVGHLDVEQLKEMTNKELKALAEDMGIDTSKMKVKDDYIQAIVAVEVSAPTDDENSEAPPNIFTEAPVV